MHLGAVLYVYKGEWGLPSIDFECLRVLCLVKFTRFPLKLETNSNPMRSGGGKLPYLQIGNEKFVGYRRIKELLDKEGYPVNAQLKYGFDKLSTSYTSWVFTQLHIYYSYFVYGESTNYDTTRALYAKRTPFPFNFFYPSTYRRDAYDVVQVMGGFDLNDKIEHHETSYIILNAKNCVNILSKKLGKKVWFFGDEFSELDAIVYSYLAIILKVPLSNNPLQNHIKGCPNIINFINRISRDVFKNEAFNSLKASKSSPNDPMLTASERKFLESEKQTKILAGVGAVMAMGLFAAWRGLYQQLATTKQRYFEGYEYDNEIDDADNVEE